ncbi:MAG: hypothetical protein IKA61_04640 [Clostridia bacterium]|nr:hypothetical protein [Clostridia bacterium]
MKKIEITDLAGEEIGISYISSAISQLVSDFGGEVHEGSVGDRLKIVILCPEKYYDLYKSEVEDKIADVIAVKYKYDFIKSRMRTIGLTPYENEILKTAIISADVDADKRYVMRKLKAFNGFAIDGIYNFRLQPLKNKWKEVISYIPFFFTGSQLCDFVAFVLGEKRGKKVFIEGDYVYDMNFNRLKRSNLISSSPDVVKEALLSPCSSVEVVKAVSSREEKELKRFFGKRVIFLNESLSKTVDKKN